MHRLSSNATLFWKLFVPIFFGTMGMMFVLAAWLSEQGDLPFLTNPIVKYSITVLYLLILVLMYFTIINLKRVEADEQHYYVTNYLKTYRYKKEDVQRVSSSNYVLFRWSKMALKEASSFGKTIHFIGNHTKEKK